jgi:hypothetical protein
MKDLNVITKTKKNQIEEITKKKKRKNDFKSQKNIISPNKLSYNSKKIKLKSSKNILQI